MASLYMAINLTTFKGDQAMTPKTQYYMNQLAKLSDERISVVVSDESGNQTNRTTLTPELIGILIERLIKCSQK